MQPSLPLSMWEEGCASEAGLDVLESGFEDLRAPTSGLGRDSTIEETLDWLPLTPAASDPYNRPLAEESVSPFPPSSPSSSTLRGEFAPLVTDGDALDDDAFRMEPTVALFLDRLLESRLMTAAEVDALRKKIPTEQLAQDPQQLARDLVQQRKLTKYQAAALYQGKTKGLVLGSYVVLERIGAGGMGEVFKARHRRLERLAAVKILPAKRVESPDAVRRFHQEVKAAAKLTHPNIIIAHDADEDDGIHYLVMEYVEGRDMGQVVKQDGRADLAGGLPVAQALDYIAQAANGLEFAHKRGIIHRDIKPRNLILDSHGVLKILDMGLARDDSAEAIENATEPIEDVTHAGQIMGSVDFMSPEQAIDSRTADARSDIYSLGCTFYALLMASVPYKSDTLVKKILAHREAEVPSVRAVRPDVPARVEALVQKMLAKKPEDRPQSMTEVVAELKQCVLGFERGEVLPPPVGARAEARAEAGGSSLAGDSGSSVSASSFPSGSLPPAAPPVRRPAPAPPRTQPPPLAGDTDRSCDPTVVGQDEILDAEIVEDGPVTTPYSFAGSPPMAPEPIAAQPAAEVVFEEQLEAPPAAPRSSAAPAEAPAPPTPAAEAPKPVEPPVPSGPSPIVEFFREYGIVIFAVIALAGVVGFLGYLILGQ